MSCATASADGVHDARCLPLDSGSTRKIYQQKGTGRARHGHIRANIFVGGAKAHGPVVRDKTYRINTKGAAARCD